MEEVLPIAQSQDKQVMCYIVCYEEAVQMYTHKQHAPTKISNVNNLHYMVPSAIAKWRGEEYV